MSGIRDRAEEAREEVYLAASDGLTHRWFRIEDEDLSGADEVSEPGEFPQYGEYLRCSRGRDTVHYVECPANLAAAIVEQVAHNANLTGRWFHIGEKRKESDEQNASWEFAVSVAPAEVGDLDELEDWADSEDWSPETFGD